MQTRYEFLEEVREELGEVDFKNLYVSLDNEYYELIEQEIKKGNKLTIEVYESLSDGQKFHFNKHYNRRNDMLVS